MIKKLYRNRYLRILEMLTRTRLFGQKNKEKNILRNLCIGKGLDIGCGSQKISPNCIGVDIIGKGEIGFDTSEKGKISIADIKTSGDNLNVFKNNELDFIVARHNLEHYSNPSKTLDEWKRVLKKRGKIGVIVPNDKYMETMKFPTHKYAFTPEKLEKLFLEKGFKILSKGQAIKHWSIYLIAEK